MINVKVCTPVKSGKPKNIHLLQALDNFQDSNYSFKYHTCAGTYIFRNRNALVNNAQSQAVKQKLNGWDFYLFIDSDIFFSLDQVFGLLNRRVSIVGGAYESREGPYFEAGQFHSQYPGLIKSKYSFDTEGLKTVDFVGAGFLLVRREVFEDLEYPWFQHPILRIGDNAEVVGEDVAFCMAAAKKFYKIHCDFGIRPKHEYKGG